MGPNLYSHHDSSGQFTLSDKFHIQICEDICAGLEYIHGCGIAHNDLKPMNILLIRENHAVICDFGLASFQHPNITATSGGTPWFVPPEYIEEGKRGCAGDIWAFGITMAWVSGLIKHPSGKGWRIQEVQLDGQARRNMRAWVKFINNIVTRLRSDDYLRAVLQLLPEERMLC